MEADASTTRSYLRLGIAIGAGVAYGLATRLIFGLDLDQRWFEIMSTTFIFVVPVSIGALSVLLLPAERAARWGAVVGTSLASAFLTAASALVLAWEGLICAIVWLPIFLLLALAGGLLAASYRLVRGRGSQVPVFCAVVLLPFALSPLEQQVPVPPEAMHTVTNRIEIAASAATIWDEIREVPPITEDELPASFAHAIGFPKPVEARLVGRGVGAVRHASFEGGVVFYETVTRWEPHRVLTFSIDPEHVPAYTFDQHVAIGGPYFDVLDGTYRIEPVGPDRSVLILESTQRLSTRFNGYTQLWTNFFMSDIQQRILEVIKQRSEAR